MTTPPRSRTMGLAFALLLLTPAVVLAGNSATASPDGPYVVVTHDTADDGVTRVGVPSTFGWVLFDDEGKPMFHHDVVFEVALNGVTLYRTTPSSGHDYDGVGEHTVAFPAPGKFEVTVTVPTDAGEVTDTFTGTVLPAAEEAVALVLDAPDVTTTDEPVTLRYHVEREDGSIVRDTSALVQVLQGFDDQEVLRVRTHSEEGMHETTVHLEAGGPPEDDPVYGDFPIPYEVRVIAYPDPRGGGNATFPAIARFHEIDVREDGATWTFEESHPRSAPTRRPLENVVDQGEADPGYRLYGTYDPYTSTGGEFGMMRLAVVVVDETTGRPVPDVDLRTRLTDAEGAVLFESGTLREHDGVHQVKVRRVAYGDYVLQVEASKDGWTGALTQRFSVHAPILPTGATPLQQTLHGVDDLQAGVPAELTLEVTNEAGLPASHVEADVHVLGPKGDLLYLTKLHTHSDGLMPFTLTLPEDGTYRMHVTCYSLEPRAQAYGRCGPGLGSGDSLGLDEGVDHRVYVAPGPGLPSPTLDEVLGSTAGADGAAAVPGPSAALAIALLGLAAAGRRRWGR